MPLRRTLTDVRRWALAAGMLAMILLGAGCRHKTAAADASAPRVERFQSGPVTVSLTADPPIVDFSRDMLLTIAARAPAGVHVQIPSLADRLSGFVLSGEYDKEPRTANGTNTIEHCARLTPVVSEEHRLAPMAIRYTDTRRRPPAAGWFPTRPIVFERGPLPRPGAGGDIADILGPLTIFPPFTTVLLYLAVGAAAAAALYAFWRLARKVRRRIELARMSPRERALAELADLLARRLVEQNRVKDFYFELTMIVRRYIERAHRVRAPEQTTEEFLTAAARNSEFPPHVLGTLRTFLQAADLVKYAAYQPGSDVVNRAVETAKNYVETDTAARTVEKETTGV